MSLRGKRLLKNITKHAKRGLRSLGLWVCVLGLAGAVSLVLEVVNARVGVELFGSVEELNEIEAEQRQTLAHAPPIDPKLLSVPLEEVEADYQAQMECASDTALKASLKETEKQVKSLTGEHNVKKQIEPTEVPDSSPCSDTHAKMLDEQAQYGAKTEGLSEGKNGAETQANLDGSVAKTTLASQNRLKQYEMTLAERNQVGPAFNRFCIETGDCEQAATPSGFTWLVPVAVARVQGGLDGQNFERSHAAELIAASQSYEKAARTEDRYNRQLTQYDQLSQLHKLLEVQTAKQQEIKAKDTVIMQAALQLEIKMDQGGASHNCSSVSASKPRWWAWQPFKTTRCEKA